MRAIYVGHFGIIWKLTQEQWLAVCRSGAAGSGYDLRSCRRLRSRPNFLHPDGEVRGSYWCSRHDVSYFEPLDWYPEDFAEHLAEIEPTLARER